jgi:hypothetical protein
MAPRLRHVSTQWGQAPNVVLDGPRKRAKRGAYRSVCGRNQA